ncbi:MAG: ATP-dependent DNA ligase [Gaiellaceae bacterium]
MPARELPFPPMEAQLVSEVPSGDWQYEPKWDGFRGVLENVGGELALWSRNGRPLLRYFPELRRLGDALPPRSALDGEIVLVRDGRLDFDALQLRLHPAESRIRRLSSEMPTDFVAFDLLLWQGEAVHSRPLEERRAELEGRCGGFRLSPASRDLDQALLWLETIDQLGLDGIVAKRLGLPYLPGSREGMVKVKPRRTADCVIVGFRWSDKADGRIATVLLGLYEGDVLRFVGHASGFPAPLRAEIERILPALVDESAIGGERMPGGQSRWSAGRDLDWVPVRPEVVCEVRYDKLQGNRFRHGAGFLRLRPDKEPRQCGWDQVEPALSRKTALSDLLEEAAPAPGAGSAESG